MPLSDWTLVASDGTIPEELLPASIVQYRWVCHHEFPVPPGFGVNGGTYEMEWELGIAGSTPAFESTDYVKFQCITLQDILFAGMIAFYTYYPTELTTTGPEIADTIGGVDPYWADDWPNYGIGLDELYITGWWHSPVYELALAAGATVNVTKHATQSGIPSPGWMLEMRTQLGRRAGRVTLKDCAVGDLHRFRIYSGMLLDRRWLNAYQSLDGPSDGCAVAAGTGLTAVVSAGDAYLGYRPLSLAAAATVDLEPSTTNHVWLTIDESGSTPALAVEVTQETLPDGVAYLIGTVETNADSVASVDGMARGTVVTFEADDYGGVIHDDGRIEVNVESGSEETTYVSRDRGLTWTAR